MIEFQLLRQDDLLHFIASPEFDSMEHLPISRQRAIAQAHNPRLQPDDVLLILARQSGQMVGYLGLLPDLIRYHGTFERISWMSCIWIDPRHRGKRIAGKLVQKAAELTDNRMLCTEFTASAKRLYDKLGLFRTLDELNGIRLYCRMDLHRILPPKKPIYRKVKPLLKVFDRLANAILDLRFAFAKSSVSPEQIEYLPLVDEETAHWIEAYQSNSLFGRKATELNWMLQYPWVLSAPSADRDSVRYHFTAVEPCFQFVPIKLRDKSGKIVAFLIFARRNQQLKLPYCYLKKAALPLVVQLIQDHILQWRIHTFSTYHPDLTEYLRKHKGWGLFQKTIRRSYLISTTFEMAGTANYSEIQDGDGDGAFT
ncbi:MAG: GNAT family N-acetyltransferase [Saprospiraceae bacterium]|nr:GNAT family N-acetyltransferase [Saprospiraceae bacterium]